jgi:single-strand DNA-binding protein
MSGEPIVTIVGNLASDPELKFQPSGKAVANFTVVQTNRVKKGDTWEDGDPTWFRCAAWEGLAENIAESLTKGTRVIVQGAMYTRAYETKEGEKRTSLELRVEAIGPELRWATAQVARVQSGGGSKPAAKASSAAQSDDPWVSDGAASATQDDAPPF